MLQPDKGLFESIAYPSDSLIPYKNSYKKQNELRENIDYINEGLSLSQNFLKTFQRMYPNIPVRDITYRVKSQSSINSKIKNLILERLSQLAVLNAEHPKQFVQYITLKNKELVETHKEPINIDYRAFYQFIKERIDETHISYNERHKCHKQLEKLEHNFINNEDQYHNMVAILLNNKEISSSTKKYLSRMIYSKIKLNPNLSSDQKDELLFDLNTNYGEIGKKFNDNKNVLDIESVTRVFDSVHSSHNLTLKNYNNRFTSKFDRLLNEQEYLRSLDLLAFTLVIDHIPNHTTIPGFDVFNNLIKKHDQEDDKIIRRELEQKAILLLGQDFFNRISTNKVDFLEENKAKEIVGMLKHKYKPGYYAEHNKFELADNQNYSIESQIKSGYIYDTTNEKAIAKQIIDNPLAVHSNRPGKTREIPSGLVTKDLFTLTPKEINTIYNELLNRTPNFYTIDQKTYKIHEYSFLENLLKTYADSIYDNAEIGDKLKTFNQIAMDLEVITPSSKKQPLNEKSIDYR